MAKAQEWVERFETAPDIAVELQAFINEIGEVATKRGNSLSAVEGAVREQRTKFLAIRSRTQNPAVLMHTFDSLLTHFGRDFRKAEFKFRKDEERRKNPAPRTERAAKKDRKPKDKGKPKEQNAKAKPKTFTPLKEFIANLKK